MKKSYKSLNQKKLLMFFFLVATFTRGWTQTNVLMTLNNAACINSKTMEFDVWIKNHGTTSIKLAGYSFGVDHNDAPPSLKNGGIITFSMNAGSRDPILSSLDNNPQLVYSNKQFKLSTLNVGPGSAVTLPTGVAYKLGRFRVKNTVSFASNYDPMLNLNAIGGTGLIKCVANLYINGSATMSSITAITGLNLVCTNPGFTLNPPCLPSFGTVNATACNQF